MTHFAFLKTEWPAVNEAGATAEALASLANLDALFASLQHRAFRGEL